MDNFRRQNNTPRKTYAALDGVVPTARRGGQYGDRTVRPMGAMPSQGAGNSGHLDNFRRSDGFQAASQPITAGSPGMATHGRQPMRDSLGNINMQLDETGKKGRVKTKKARKRWKRTVIKTFLVVFLAGVLTTGYIFGKGYLKARSIFKGGGDGAAALQANVDPSELRGEGDGRVNILVLGKGGPGHEGPDLTDTLVVASIDPVQNQAALLSIPRDLYVTPESGNPGKINSVYALAKEKASYQGSNAADAEKAGVDAIQSTVATAMGIPIHYYLMVDFTAFKEAIDTVGGISVDVKTQLYDPTVAWENANNPLIAAVGLQSMDGKKALLYARSRHGSLRGDFDRAERQREVILALKDKVLSAGTYSNPLKISQLIDAFGNHISTNLAIADLMRLYEIGKSIDASKVASIGLADPPNNYVRTDSINNSSVVVPIAGVDDFSAIQNYVRNAMKDGFLEQESATIGVLNGTNTAGLAGRKSTELKSFGYTISATADAPTKNYTKTVIVDLTNGAKKYTKHYLEERFGVTAVTTIPDPAIAANGADFVIILGTDAAQ